MKYIIGTRGSKLALVQTELVIKNLKSAYPQDEFIAEGHKDNRGYGSEKTT